MGLHVFDAVCILEFRQWYFARFSAYHSITLRLFCALIFFSIPSSLSQNHTHICYFCACGLYLAWYTDTSLWNLILPVREHQANSHAKKGWEEFTDAVIKTISQKKSGLVFLLWGNSAQSKTRLIDGTKHHILKSAHPSGLSANRGFFGCRHFSKTNQILEKLGLSAIDWQL